MKKYIQRNEQGQAGKRWHSDPHCSMIKPGNRVVVAPDSMLRAYGIEKECETCQLRDSRKAHEDKCEDLRAWQSYIVVASNVIGVQLSQDALRGYLTQAGISFSLRASKEKMARLAVIYWIRAKDYDIMRVFLDSALNHWTHRLEVNDRHRPTYYKQMQARAERSLSLLTTLSNPSDTAK